MEGTQVVRYVGKKVLIGREGTIVNPPIFLWVNVYLVSIENPLEPAQCMRFAKCCVLGSG